MQTCIVSQTTSFCLFAAASKNGGLSGWFWFVLIALIVAIAVYARNQAWLKCPEERRKAAETAAHSWWNIFHVSATLEEIAGMTGTQFEVFLARLFERMGYTEIALTPINDQGGDILCRSNGSRVVVQAKRWKGAVGNAAVQELLGAMLHYGCTTGMVVTNSRFTAPAYELAAKDFRITLRDGRWLGAQIAKYLPPQIPVFNWKEFNRAVKSRRPGFPRWMEAEFEAAEAREDPDARETHDKS